jgi:hypothetical protein
MQSSSLTVAEQHQRRTALGHFLLFASPNSYLDRVAVTFLPFENPPGMVSFARILIHAAPIVLTGKILR